jgi:nicotinate-nucleotide--dimethylbenzimidazole phosphoribosyltransferase
LCSIYGKNDFSLTNKVIFTFAADHGVAAQGVSLFPQEVTGQMVYNFLSGGAGVNVLAAHAQARVVVADLGVAEDLNVSPRLIIKKVAKATADIALGPAMTKQQAIQAIENGIEIFEAEFTKGIDIVGLGEMGIANTTPASAITAVICKRAVEEITGRGTGIDDIARQNKIKIIERALQVNQPDGKNGLDVLAKVGGFEIGGLAGVVLAACSRRIPVVVDGFISASAALIAAGLCSKVKPFLFASHNSVEPGHKAGLDWLELKPFLNLDMRLGEGTGAALAFGIIEASIKIAREMATFESGRVSREK